MCGVEPFLPCVYETRFQRNYYEDDKVVKSKLLSAAAISTVAFILISCSKTSAPQVEKVTDVDPAAVETLVVEAATRPSSELAATSKPSARDSAPTVQEAKEFLEATEEELVEYNAYASKVYWIKANFITEDTAALEARAGAEGLKLSTRISKQAKRFKDLSLPADMQRKMDGLLRGSNFPAPDDESAAKELAQIMSNLDGTYGKGRFEIDVKDERIIKIDIIKHSDDPKLLQATWEAWRTIAKPMKGDYADMVGIINKGSEELGFKDAGDLWRAGYDMDAAAFSKEADRLWGQVKPLYI